MPEPDDSITAAEPSSSPAQVEDVVHVSETAAATGGLTWTPFAIYLAAWVALATATGYLLREATAESPARWMPEYPALLWAGVGLAAAGPAVSFAVWLVARARRAGEVRRGLLTSAMMRGALMAVLGVAIWLGTLYVVEAMTLNGALG